MNSAAQSPHLFHSHTRKKSPTNDPLPAELLQPAAPSAPTSTPQHLIFSHAKDGNSKKNARGHRARDIEIEHSPSTSVIETMQATAEQAPMKETFLQSLDRFCLLNRDCPFYLIIGAHTR